jgi:hypothetical protein
MPVKRVLLPLKKIPSAIPAMSQITKTTKAGTIDKKARFGINCEGKLVGSIQKVQANQRQNQNEQVASVHNSRIAVLPNSSARIET